MSSKPSEDRAEIVTSRASKSARMPRVVYALLGTLLVSYLASLVLRSEGDKSLLVDGWLVAGFELVASALCFSRALGLRRGRTVPLALGCALLSWSIGDALLTAESVGGATPPTPSLADAFYLGFYPLAYVALVLIVRRETRSLIPATWLDGGVAGLGVASVCACFAFNTILRSVGGDPLAVATNLAYPIGDVLLLALVVGGTAILSGRRNAAWIMLATACGVNAIGDTFNLFQSSGGASHIGTVFDGIAWPTAILLMSMSVWLRPAASDPLAAPKAPGVLLPGLGALSGLAVLFVGTLRHLSPWALGLAIATLITVGIRIAMSTRSLRTLTEERRLQSVTDELTGLGNRRYLFQVLDAFFVEYDHRRGPERRLAFLFVDLDHFKEINDSFGHSAGDQLLKQLGPRLAGSLRGSDLLVRLGGDELGVVLIDTDLNHASGVAERLLARIQEPFMLEGVSVRISASIGIAFAPADATDTVGLLHHADLAMYRAKLGASAFEFYKADIDAGGNRLRLVDELRVAVETGDFVLHYQPQVDLHSGEVTAVEALLRWPHPRLGVVPPLQFLPLAEEAGLMRPLTAWVLDQALAQCAAWRKDAHELAVSVNVSATNLVDAGFIDVVSDTLARHGLPTSALILEITETTIIGDFERCKHVIAQLCEGGLTVSIDDFGAGFTSLAYLGSLAVRELKLDRGFITPLVADGDGRDLELVRATIDLGHALGLRVVAEGIETAGTLDLLARIGCDLAQGFFISRPVPASDLALHADFRPAVPSVDELKAS